MPVYYRPRINPLIPQPSTFVPKILADKLGAGLTVPMVLFGNRWDITSGPAKVKQDMFMTLSTPINTRLGQPDYGSELPYMIFGEFTDTLRLEMLRATRDALKKWVPQIIVENATVSMPSSQSGQNNIAVIVINYLIKGTASFDILQVALSSDDSIQFPPDTFKVNGLVLIGSGLGI